MLEQPQSERVNAPSTWLRGKYNVNVRLEKQAAVSHWTLSEYLQGGGERLEVCDFEQSSL